MNVFFFKPEEYERLYNCNLYDIEQVPLSERQHIGIGISFFVLFAIFLAAYIPSLWIMKKKPFWNQPCYKLMFFMGITDICCLIIIGPITGYYSIYGYVFCSSPKTQYIAGALSFFFWVATCDMGIMLAVNRCLEMYNQIWAAFIFDKWKCYFLVFIAIFDEFAITFWSKPVVFSSIYVTWAFNPHVGYLDVGSTYYNIWHSAHNMSVVGILSTLYLIFLLLLRRKTHYTTQSWKSQKEAYIQVFLVCFTTGTAAG
uniref:Uncharacterized protein n=1 Tax=Panagrolaimus sp. JU765 TaxID=591449 RepID=A0AC34RH99_9BILA